MKIKSKVKKEVQEKTHSEAAEILKKAEEKIKKQGQELSNALRQETINLVILATEKILNQQLDESTKNKLIADAIKDIKQSDL